MSKSEIAARSAADAHEEGTDRGQEIVQQMPIRELHAFEGHPFKVLDDDLMTETVESVKSIGIVSPLTARTDPDGGYELLSGHRRLRAAQLAGLESVPVVVKEMDDDAAIIFLVDSNLQRDGLLPSERAFAYRMKLEAMKHKAGRPSKDKENYSQVGNNSGKRSSEEMAEELGTSKNQIFRYIRLTNLIPELLDMVDEKKISFNPAVELSYLKPSEQKEFLTAMDYGQTAPSVSQAQRIKKLSQEGACTLDAMNEIMIEEKKSDLDPIILPREKLRKYFPKSYTPKQVEDTIMRVLDQWHRGKNRQQAL